MDEQQELYTALRTGLICEGFDVYDADIPTDPKYPFIVMADTTTELKAVKFGRAGKVTQHIYVYHNSPKKRGTLSDMVSKVQKLCGRLIRTRNYSWKLTNYNAKYDKSDETENAIIRADINATFIF